MLNNVLELIFEHLDEVCDIVRCSCVNRQWRLTGRSVSPQALRFGSRTITARRGKQLRNQNRRYDYVLSWIHLRISQGNFAVKEIDLYGDYFLTEPTPWMHRLALLSALACTRKVLGINIKHEDLEWTSDMLKHTLVRLYVTDRHVKASDLAELTSLRDLRVPTFALDHTLPCLTCLTLEEQHVQLDQYKAPDYNRHLPVLESIDLTVAHDVEGGIILGRILSHPSLVRLNVHLESGHSDQYELYVPAPERYIEVNVSSAGKGRLALCRQVTYVSANRTVTMPAWAVGDHVQTAL